MSELSIKRALVSNHGHLPSQDNLRQRAGRSSAQFLFIFVSWAAAVAWFGPRLVEALNAAQGPVSGFALSYFLIFVCVAWLYGIYNLSVILFAAIYRRFYRPNDYAEYTSEIHTDAPAVAVLYTTCNDFVQSSFLSCVGIEYPNFKVYVLDDSSDPDLMREVDRVVANYPNAEVIRRSNRKGHKAGNLNHALSSVVTEPYFVIADSDEVLPRNFLTMLVPRLEADANCGFIQASHRCVNRGSRLQQDMYRGIDVHWKWYQPLRNRFGFVMFLGHGALLRTSAWHAVGGFPEVVSEDLAYAIALREIGYYGTFAEDVICLEEFPDTVRAFRVRHVKWTRGTCEFLNQYAWKLIRSHNISTAEKLDILFPTANLPMTLFFFFFMVMTAIVLPLSIGERSLLTLEYSYGSATVPVVLMPSAMNGLYAPDFFAMTLATIFAPILCFVLELWRKPVILIRFLAHSTALYAALSPLSTICILGYLFTGKARFLVTGDRTDQSSNHGTRYWAQTHPDAKATRLLELLAAMIFFAGALASFQIALFGLAVGFALQAVLHTTDWGKPGLQQLSWLPFTTISASIALGSMSLVGLQPVMFGFGFHF